MASAAVLEKLLHKLVRLNAMVGTPAAGTIAADIAVIQALAVTNETLLGTAAMTSVTVDIADIQTVLNAVGT